MIPFPPVIEPEHEGAFLTERPREAPAPHGQQLPLMLGVTAEEGLLKTAALLNLPDLMTEFKTHFEQLLPIVLNYDHHEPEEQQQITRHIESFYFKAGHNYNKSNHQNLTDVGRILCYILWPGLKQILSFLAYFRWLVRSRRR